METNYIGCLIGMCIVFYISSIKTLEDRDITAITCVGWAIYVLFAKGGLKWDLPPIGPVVDKVIEKSVEFVSVIGPGLKV